MKIPALMLTLSTFLLFGAACSRSTHSGAIVVHLFRDPSATEIDTALREMSESRLVISSGRPIVVATQESKNYQEGLAIVSKGARPDVVVLNSSEDTKLFGLMSVVVIKSGTRQYFAGVPPWVQGEEQTAANEVLFRLQTILEPSGR